jgi:predicted nucleotidyltransferase
VRNKSPNLEILAVVAKGLRGLKEKVAFIGGATIDLYVTYPADAASRPTDDVDCVVEMASRGQYYGIEEELRSLGFKNFLGKGPVCRWEYRGIMVDVMPTEGKILGFTNRWYPAGLANTETAVLPDGQRVEIFTAPYLLATKLEAFSDRGREDFYSSPDIEDIVAVLDGCPDLKERIQSAPADVRSYLADKFQELLSNDRFVGNLPGHVLDRANSEVRAARVLALLKTLSADS